MKDTKKLEAVKFRNAIIGINNKIQMAVVAAQLGMGGGNSIILKGIRDIDKLCKEAVGGNKDGKKF